MQSLFVVLEFNQASGQPDWDQAVSLCDDLDEARDLAADLTRYKREAGRRETYRVFELVEPGDES